MNIARRTSIGSVSHDTFAFAAWTFLAVFASLADIAEPTTMTVTGRTFSATVANGTNFLAHKLILSVKVSLAHCP